MKLSIITLNYKKKEYTLKCIASLNKQYEAEFKNNNFEVIIVDNASGENSDDSVPVLRQAIKKYNYKNMQVIANKENGFANGCNLGATYAKGRYFLFLNNDTEVLDKGLTAMIDFMQEHPEVGILGGKLRETDGSEQLTTGRFYTLLNATIMLLGLERYLAASPAAVTKVDWTSGGCMLVRREVFVRLQGFDKEIFMYMEDLEICYRAKKKGFSTYFYPSIDIRHVGQGSSNRIFAIVNIYKGLLYFYRKHMPLWQYNFIHFLLMSKSRILIVIGKLIHNSYYVQPYEQTLAVL